MRKNQDKRAYETGLRDLENPEVLGRKSLIGSVVGVVVVGCVAVGQLTGGEPADGHTLHSWASTPGLDRGLATGSWPASAETLTPSTPPAPVRVVPLTPEDAPPASTVSVIGHLTARTNGTGSDTPSLLALSTISIEAVIGPVLASTTIEHTFQSESPDITEGLYEVTIPKGASVDRYSLSSEDGWLDGRFVDRSWARRVYESYLPKRRDPGLVEWQDGQRFSARVFPIPPKGEKGVLLGYTAPSLAEAGRVRWRLPLSNVVSHAGLRSFRAQVRIAAPGQGTDGVQVRRHPGVATIARVGGEVIVSVEGVEPAADSIVIDIDAPRTAAPSFFVAPPREGEEAGYGLVLVPPSTALPARPAETARGADFVLVLDRSGSMAGEQIGDAIDELYQALLLLGPKDRFAVITFSSEADQVTKGFLPADRQTARDLATNLRQRGTGGGTKYELAFAASAGLLAGRDDAERSASVILITDGQGFEDLTTSPGAPLFCVPVGTSERQAMDLSARRHGGYAVGGAEEAIGLAPGRALARITASVASHKPAVHPEEAVVFDSEQELAFAFRLQPDRPLPSSLSLSIRDHDSVARRVDVPLPAPIALASGPLARVWARSRITDLLRTPSEHREELTQLGVAHRFVTPFTSILVLESEEEYQRWGIGENGEEITVAKAGNVGQGASRKLIILEEEVVVTQDIPRGSDLSSLSNKNLGSSGATVVYGAAGGSSGAYGRAHGGGSMKRDTVAAAGTESSVTRQHPWLRRNQAPDGSWARGDGTPDVGVTALSLLTFLSIGQTHRFGMDKACIANGLKWLKAQQQSDGSIGDSLSDHALATLALCEAYAMSRDFTLKRYSQQAVTRLLSGASKAAPFASESSTCEQVQAFGWVVLAVKSAQAARLKVPDGALGTLVPPARPSQDEERLCWAASVALSRVLARPGDARDIIAQDPALASDLDFVMANPPAWPDAVGDVTADLCYWHHATLVIFQLGGDEWKRWSERLAAVVLPEQRTSDEDDGSWDPVGPCGLRGGRVRATALTALTLETIWRSERAKR